MIIENKKDTKILSLDLTPDVSVEPEEINTDELLLEICTALREGGYNPVSQIVGYIISEDPTHIANYNNARTMMSKIDRDDLLEAMVTKYIEHIESKVEENA